MAALYHNLTGPARLRLAGLDAESRALTIRTLELFPFDGFHIQANMRHRGPMPHRAAAPRVEA